MARFRVDDPMPDELEGVRVELLKARGAYLGALRAGADHATLAALAGALAALERRRAELEPAA